MAARDENGERAFTVTGVIVTYHVIIRPHLLQEAWLRVFVRVESLYRTGERRENSYSDGGKMEEGRAIRWFGLEWI